ncbi:glycosyltransferase family 4 protein [Anaerocolumna jejuensis]|nr:glycosyltransferase family 4 protein [Anaerocolumna jejuensis]
MMRILLVQLLEYLYPWGGAHKANRILMEGLTERGHECVVVTPEVYIGGFEEYFNEKKNSNEFEISAESENVTVIRKKGVTVYRVEGEYKIFSFIRKMVEDFKPDITLISEDKSHLLMEAVLETKTRTICLAHSQTVLPFGPECFEEKQDKTALYPKLHGIISVSDYLQSYFKKWAGLESKRIYFPSYGKGPFPFLGNFDNPYITVINPSGIKGFPIIAGLARSFPKVQFAAVITWSTTKAELEELKAIENVIIMKPEENVDVIYRQTKVFLMPSLWGEAFGQVVVEAMLRGIPVIASNVGGLPEAKQGLNYILPVNPIKKYISEKELLMSVHRPVLPEQNLKPWIETLGRLINDRRLYEELSGQSYEKAAQFHSKLGFEEFEQYFREVMEAYPDELLGKKNRNHSAGSALERINLLSPEKREQLYERLRKTGGKV